VKNKEMKESAESKMRKENLKQKFPHFWGFLEMNISE